MTERNLAAEGAWAPGPGSPSLRAGAVHVWRADLTAVAQEICLLLSSEEHARAERILQERNRRLWTRSRALLRELLGRYVRQDPRSLCFATGPHGKPALREPEDDSAGARAPAPLGAARPCFNMSHSGQWALYAFSQAGAVGVDVEVARRPVDEVSIAARALGRAQAQRLESLDPANRPREFRRMWVRHEAELKCLGVGIGGADAVSEEHRPRITELEMGPDAAGALAAENRVRELCCWEWRA